MSGGSLEFYESLSFDTLFNLKLTWSCTLPVSFQVLDVQSGIALETCMFKPESTAKSQTASRLD